MEELLGHQAFDQHFLSFSTLVLLNRPNVFQIVLLQILFLHIMHLQKLFRRKYAKQRLANT